MPKKVLGGEKKKYLSAIEIIKEKTNLEKEIADNLNPITAFGLVYAILSLEYKKEHPEKNWDELCNCEKKNTPHYHYIITMFENDEWIVKEKESLSA